jgi:hypothetical protein
VPKTKKISLIVLSLVAVGSIGALIYLNADQISRWITQSNGQSAKDERAGKEGLVAHWSFEEGQGSRSNDISGNNLQARITGATWTTGKKGSALEFDGQNDFVEIEQSGLKVVGSLEYGTVSLWFKFKKPGSKRILPLFYLGEKDGPEAIDNLIIEIGHFGHGSPPDQKLYYTLYDQNYEPVLCFDSGVNLKADTWYHFAVVNSPSGNTGYLNGIELTNRHYNFSNAKDTRFFKTLTKKDTFLLGYGWFGIDRKFHYYKGSIDEVKIYNRPLTASEIKTLAAP